MPITSIGSYIPTTGEFMANWTLANTEPEGAVALGGGYTFDNLQTDRTRLMALINLVQSSASDLRIQTDERDNVKAFLMEKHAQFRGMVLGLITDADILKALPVAPRINADSSKFLAPLNATALVWERINAAPPTYGLPGPLTLSGDYTVGQFRDKINDLMPSYNSVQVAEVVLSRARTERDNAMAAIYERMKQYRAMLPSVRPAHSPALMNLPRLSPAPSTTPPPLLVSGAWEASIGAARLAWAASTAPNLDKLQVRGCVTAVYKSVEEEIVADLDAAATEFQTTWGLGAPGQTASFKVYVMTTTGNENGGKAVKISRP